MPQVTLKPPVYAILMWENLGAENMLHDIVFQAIQLATRIPSEERSPQPCILQGLGSIGRFY
ncbi:hypothetical protein VB005_01438 [Metarhizium brunneum]